MKLEKKDIEIIDNFLLQQKIKYLDLRSELIDHLASEFEECSKYALLDDFLITKVGFINKFTKKQKKAIHWSYQKKLWIEFGKFFYNPKRILVPIAIVFFNYFLLQYVTLKTLSLIWFFVLALLVMYPIFYQIKYSKAVKNVQSMQSLFSVTAPPSVFLYFFHLYKDLAFENLFFLVAYFGFSILLGISAVLIIEKDRKKVLRKYYQLIS